MIRTFFVVCCFSIMSNTFSHQYKYPKHVSVVSGFESKNSYISYVTIDGVKYLLKQKKTMSKQFSVVRDTLAAWIAQDLNIAQSVTMISAHDDFPGKKNKKWPATLHTIAPGSTVRSQRTSKYHALCLKQRIPDSELAPDRWLTETIIHQMTWHKQLPALIALDLFLCNTDRHGGNLFYDPKTDSFCAIDMDNIFRRDLPDLAYKKLRLMLQQEKQFSKEEIEALRHMRETLVFLLRVYTAKRLLDKFHFLIRKAGFTKGSPLYTEKIGRKIARNEHMIVQSRTSAFKLLALLQHIIIDFS